MLTSVQQSFLETATERLSYLPGVSAVVLGGSHARGTAGPDSDIDIAIYYHAVSPPDIDALRQVAAELSGNPEQQITALYEWGRWVNGGAWLSTPVGKVDILYREIDKVRRTIDDAHMGKCEQDYLQQPAFGFYSIAYLEETRCCIPLYDPDYIIAELKTLVDTYPAPLRTAVINDHLWLAEFTLQWAKGFVARNDIYSSAGCFSRIGASLIQVLYAINDRYFLSDKAVILDVPTFAKQPIRFMARLNDVLGYPGQTQHALQESLNRLTALWQDVKLMCS
jgi:predicted nucleotidyltransferase